MKAAIIGGNENFVMIEKEMLAKLEVMDEAEKRIGTEDKMSKVETTKAARALATSIQRVEKIGVLMCVKQKLANALKQAEQTLIIATKECCIETLIAAIAQVE